MNKHVLILALFSLIPLHSCKNTPKPAQAEPSEKQQDSIKSSIPDSGDLLQTLQGLWQNEQDSSYTLEFADTQMRHFKAGKLLQQSLIEVDGACENALCKPEGADTSEGWCFTEMTLEQGKYMAKCHFVKVCDTAKLQYYPLGAGTAVYSFKKIQ